ncbi:hypothetical protein [Actinospica robiniae]|uniref:hypothetical protein n=1 Tax=Actinospica robiniae TaxID=304901 RepID=UPI000405A02C|nr:hypothetical protein [Actinospica robiniae]
MAEDEGRTFAVYPEAHIVVVMFACVTAGSIAPGVHDASGRGPDNARHESGAVPVSFPGSCT